MFVIQKKVTSYDSKEENRLACSIQAPRWSGPLNCESANMEKNGKKLGKIPFSCSANFSRAFDFRVVPTI